MNRHGEQQFAALQQVEEPLNEYISAHIDPEDDYLYRLYRATNIHTIHGRMASGHIQGRLLKMLVTMIRPKRILEVGTFSGYSALCMAEGLDDDGKLYTFEINDEMEDFPLLTRSSLPLETPTCWHHNSELPSTWLSSTVTNAPISRLIKWR